LVLQALIGQTTSNSKDTFVNLKRKILMEKRADHLHPRSTRSINQEKSYQNPFSQQSSVDNEEEEQ
jgi:hypothetical protein